MQSFINKELKEATIPNRIKKLGEILNRDISLVYKNLNIELKPKWFSVCLYLIDKGSASINEIATALELTHPAIIQVVNEMAGNNILKSLKDNNDKRKRMVSLTKNGKEIFNSILPLFEDIDESIKALGKSAGYDILHIVDSLEKSVQDRNLYKLVMEKHKKRLLDSVEILRYSPQYKDNFLQLNYEWINKYFKVEEEDKKILSNPEEIIISNGGEIFFARINNEIIGTCAAVKADKNTYELAKMAVTEKARGKQAGKKLALAVIGFAYSNGARSVILETNSGLHSAIKLYESIGFKNVPGIFDSKYERSTFRMELALK